MKWEEVKSLGGGSSLIHTPGDWIETEIECPECGKKIYKQYGIVLTSSPPQYKYSCKCGWSGTAFV